MPSSRIERLLRSAQELQGGVRAHGACASAQALVLARWAREGQTPLVVLCPDDDSASSAAQDWEALSRSLLGREGEACLLPSWEQSPYSPITPSIRTRLERVSALTRIALGALGQAPAPPVLFTTIAASSQATLAPGFLNSVLIPLRVDESVESRDRLAARLLEAGYLRVDPVEDPGTFAIRGEIVDIFPPGREKPLRVELFGDQVERIREFDAATQRANPDDTRKLREVIVGPAREVLLNRSNTAEARERIKLRADDLGISRSVRDPVLASVQDGAYPDHSDCWAPLAYPGRATLWDHLPKDWPVVWLDELGCLQKWDELWAEHRRSEGDLTQSGVIMPAVGDLFLWNAELEREVKSRSRLYLDRLESIDLSQVGQEEEEPAAAPGEGADEPVSARHTLFAPTNRELGQGSRQALGDLEPRFRLWMRQRFRVLALASTQSQLERIRFLLEERELPVKALADTASPETDRLTPGLITLGLGSLSSGFRWPAEGLVLVTEDELLGSRHVRKQKKPRGESGSAAKDWAGLQALSDLAVGDAVVHVDHGIGRYQGMARLALSGAPADFLLVEYANKDKLYLPVYRLNVIQKYGGASEAVQLDKLGGAQFQKAKEKVKDSVRKLAIDLVQLYAQRKIHPGIQFPGRDAAFQEFEARFPFDETPDQLKAVDDMLSDLESGKVMDRLVCGDVGYGKTEVAMRAAFRVASEGRQVAVLVPTTVLAHQHEQNFKSRFKDLPFHIDSVSRFKSGKEQKKTIQAAAEGQVDILVGTHRLLSRDIRFRDLGLIIVDEEQRFGVEHKERLKTLKVNTHVLTLTATPIPRTLHMALSGLRDISLINTPPVDRLPIRTYVSRFDEALIQQAIQVELKRGGQVFFVHNRVQSIHEMASRIRELVPEARVVVGHGQMAEGELEEVMIAFYEKRANVLVCTTIIESGLDLPSANTIIVNRADAFGLAQLYQIRGRVGRGQARAYAYLLMPPEGAVTEDAKKRLEVIQRFVELGSGFSIASHDLDIRGGGDLLGAAQSGHIAAVGFELYMELLEEAIRELNGKPLSLEESAREPEIKVPFPAFLSEEFVPDVHQRLSLYRRFSAARDELEVERLEEELQDRFGQLPAEAQNLLWLIRIKLQLKRIGVDALTVGPEKVVLTPGPISRLDPARAIALVSSQPKRYQLTPESRFVAKLPVGSLRDLCFGMETLIRDLTPRAR